MNSDLICFCCSCCCSCCSSSSCWGRVQLRRKWQVSRGLGFLPFLHIHHHHHHHHLLLLLHHHHLLLLPLWLSEKEEIFVFFLGSLWETRGGWSLWDLCGVVGREGGREGGKIFEASASLLKVASFFVFLFFFLGLLGGFCCCVGSWIGG